MRSTVFLGLLLVGLVTSAPTSNEDDEKVTVTKEFFLDEFAVYTSQYDIVNLFVPLNALNFNDDSDDDDSNDDSGTTLFFVEADLKENAVEEKGLYVLRNGTAKKLLDHGRDAAATNNEGKLVYFAAKDGIYVYNAEKVTAEKYGTVTDSLIGIAKENGTDTIYVLGEDKKLYKVTEDGNKKVKVDDVENAEQIVMDASNNLYYYGSDKKPRVINSGGVKIIEGLPENPGKITLLRPPFVIEEGIPVIIDNKGYIIYATGKSEISDFELAVQPTAYAMEATLIQYYAYGKKIYEYNVLAIILGEVLEELKTYLDDKTEAIQSIATRSRSDLRSNALF